jgi:hypothetical protein
MFAVLPSNQYRRGQRIMNPFEAMGMVFQLPQDRAFGFVGQDLWQNDGAIPEEDALALVFAARPDIVFSERPGEAVVIEVNDSEAIAIFNNGGAYQRIVLKRLNA